MVFKKETGEMVAYGTGDLSQWNDTDIYYIHTPEIEIDPAGYTYTYDGTEVIQSDLPEHDLTGS